MKIEELLEDTSKEFETLEESNAFLAGVDFLKSLRLKDKLNEQELKVFKDAYTDCKRELSCDMKGSFEEGYHTGMLTFILIFFNEEDFEKIS